MKFDYLLRESQFHGGRRLAVEHFRNWWRLVLLVLFGASSGVVYMTVQRFFSNPTFMVREDIMTPIKDFPSVVVCPEVKFSDWKIEEFLNDLEIPQNLNRSYILSCVNQLSAFITADTYYKSHDLENLELLLEHNQLDVETALQMLTTNCEETFIRCRWRGKFVNCSDLFSMELTGDGYCCVFNGRSLKRQSKSYDHGDSSLKRRTTVYAGFSSGLMLAINQSQIPSDVDLSYKWLALQGSQHFVESSNNGTPLNPGSEQWVALHVYNLQIAEDARTLSENLKKCRMGSDRLQYFPLYTKKYCLVECEMQLTLKACNCVRHIHPLPPGVKVCRANRLRCAKHTKVTYDSELCNCPTECDVARDVVLTSSFKLMPSTALIDPFYQGLNFDRVTIVRTYLQTRRESTNTRWPYFGKFDLFAQLGGVYSLFFGCSVLTLLELFILAKHWWKRSERKNTLGMNYANNYMNGKPNKNGRKGKKKQKIKTIS